MTDHMEMIITLRAILGCTTIVAILMAYKAYTDCKRLTERALRRKEARDAGRLNGSELTDSTGVIDGGDSNVTSGSSLLSTETDGHETTRTTRRRGRSV